MRIRSPFALLAALCVAGLVCSAVPSVSAATTLTVRDVGALAGFQTSTPSWDVQPGDFNGDGWTDVFFSHHGQPGELYRNRHPDGSSAGFTLFATFKDRRHHWHDRHGCAWGDVNQDERPDIVCMKGAKQGTVKKWNELWIQQPDRTFRDRAHDYGVEDVWGRGRHPSFIDINHDRWPDLFLGNDMPRLDGNPTPNRTFVNEGGTTYSQVFMGLTKEMGAHCVQTVDLNHDGWDDLVLCANTGLQLLIRAGDRFVDRRADLGIPAIRPTRALVADLDGDGWEEILTMGGGSVRIYPNDGSGSFGDAWSHPLTAGRGLAVGDVDGSGSPDVLAVQGCVDSINQTDVLLLNGGDLTSWTDMPNMPADVPGCGDAAAALDFDHDGMDDLVIQNGAYVRAGVLPGPDQLLTLGSWGLGA
jgi:hypothetical protein